MKFAAAFNKLGYELAVPRTDWSASNDAGVCLSLWRSEIDWKLLGFDTRLNAGPPDTWNAAGNNKRMRHLASAVEHFSGWVDIVVVDGVPGQGITNATPWSPADRKGLKWRVTWFDYNLGHFSASAQPERRS